MRKQLITPLLLIATSLMINTGCEKEESSSLPPSITTLSINEITSNSAKGGGNVIDEGSGPVASRGLVWGTSENPTVEDNIGKTNEGEGTGEFTSEITKLSPNTTYFVRAYASNSNGFTYGKQKKFTTLEVYDLTIETKGEGTVNKEVVEKNQQIMRIILQLDSSPSLLKVGSLLNGKEI